jgi:hypothetical protein
MNRCSHAACRKLLPHAVTLLDISHEQVVNAFAAAKVLRKGHRRARQKLAVECGDLTSKDSKTILWASEAGDKNFPTFGLYWPAGQRRVAERLAKNLKKAILLAKRINHGRLTTHRSGVDPYRQLTTDN